MRVSLRLAGAALVMAVALSGAGRAEDASPELPVAEWSPAHVFLEDFKGQITVICFYNDSSG